MLKAVRFASYIRNRRGATAVEFALTFPFFIIFILVILEASIFFFANSNAEQLVHNHSRNLILMTTRPSRVDVRESIQEELSTLINPTYFRSFRFAIDTARPNTNFNAPLHRNSVGRNYLNNRDQPLYMRLVLQRRAITYNLLKPLWQLMDDPTIGGLYAPIDILIVIPFPPIEN